jgi:hypothetical protein
MEEIEEDITMASAAEKRLRGWMNINDPEYNSYSDQFIEDLNGLLDEVQELRKWQAQDMKQREWHSNALEVLQPLRYHLNEMIESIESYNRFALRLGYVPITCKLAEAKSAQEVAEKFFCGPKDNG